MPNEDLIKHREVRFCQLHPDPAQAKSALLLLSDAEGVVDIRLADSTGLYISYDVRIVTLQAIESVLERLGYHLDNRLLTRLKRALYVYVEDAQRENLGCNIENNNNTALSIKSYTKNYHGCRDKRPDHWRKYL